MTLRTALSPTSTKPTTTTALTLALLAMTSPREARGQSAPDAPATARATTQSATPVADAPRPEAPGVTPSPRPEAAASAGSPSPQGSTEGAGSTSPAEPPAAGISNRAGRLSAARAACREARSTDVVGVATVPILAVAGVSLAVVGFTTPEAQRNATTSFLNAFAPGLVLGAVGVPLGRGWIGAVDPLHAACDTLLDHERPSDADLLSTEGLLRAFGGPASPVLPILMASATAAVGGGLAAAFLIPNRDLAQAMGGIGAAVVAGWALVPSTPNLRAARRHTLGAYAPTVTSVAMTNNSVSFAGTF
jgi:hypothetical protein